jgi:hypothetical protein
MAPAARPALLHVHPAPAFRTGPRRIFRQHQTNGDGLLFGVQFHFAHAPRSRVAQYLLIQRDLFHPSSIAPAPVHATAIRPDPSEPLKSALNAKNPARRRPFPRRTLAPDR